jgi:hypothetical protein
MATVRHLLAIVCSALLLYCAAVAQSNKLDRKKAKKVSDAFIADVVAKRLEDAVAKTSDSERETGETLRWHYTRILNLCGKPVSSKSLDDGLRVLGEDIQSGSNKRTTLVFEYLCKTNLDTDQTFAVEVQMTEDEKYWVSGLSCHKPSTPGT